MKKLVYKNILINLGVTGIFVVFNNWVYQNYLEETFIFLAISYGIVVILVNAIFIFRNSKSWVSDRKLKD